MQGSTRVRRGAVLGIIVVALSFTACGGGAKGCGENIASVKSLDFFGANVIPDDPGFVGYAVTATIEKVDPTKEARLCYAVRDDDPWYKFFWAVDDVLDAYFMHFPSDVSSRRLEGQFLLENRDDEVCGAGAIPGADKVRDCSGESEAEVYIHPVTEADGPVGPDSPQHVIRVQ